MKNYQNSKMLQSLGVLLLVHFSTCYYEAQYNQVAPLEASRDVCVNMVPPYIGRKPMRNRFPLKVEVECQWISFKRLSICAFSPPDRYQAFAGIMVQIMKDNEPFGQFEADNKVEITDCPPGEKNLVCLRSSYKMLQAAVNWVSPPGFDVYTQQLECVATIIALNQKYWTISFPVKPAPYKYPEYGNFTSEMIRNHTEP